MQFDVGESVVVPGWGVGEIAGLEKVDVGEGDAKMVRIDIGDEKKRMWVPEGRMHAECVRGVMKSNEVKETLSLIKNGTAPEKRATWNRRQRRYMELVSTNTPQSLGELMGELGAVRRKKRLSFTERRMFDRVHDQLAAEIACALDVSVDEAGKKIDKAVGPRADK